MEVLVVIGVIVGLILLGNLWNSFERIRRDADRYAELKPRLDAVERLELEQDQRSANLDERDAALDRKAARQERGILRLADEKALGFPWLAKAYADYFALELGQVARRLETKRHPAPRAAEQVREVRKLYREAERMARVNEYVVMYYESLFPWLVELRDPNIDDLLIQAPAEAERAGRSEDPSRRWLSEAEWSQLNSAERSDLALRRYQERWKTNWEIGRDYERYIGYHLELDQYQVRYVGIIDGFSDLGRDLVAERHSGDVQIVQCKYWSLEKEIHEKHVFQLFGTRVAYEIDHAPRRAKAVLVTSTVLSSRARMFANQLGVEYRENVPLEPYPLVKCNVARQSYERIYHLPFDQQYDRTIIEPERGEFYAWTAEEAEKAGFRRAFRWRGASE